MIEHHKSNDTFHQCINMLKANKVQNKHENKMLACKKIMKINCNTCKNNMDLVIKDTKNYKRQNKERDEEIESIIKSQREKIDGLKQSIKVLECMCLECEDKIHLEQIRDKNERIMQQNSFLLNKVGKLQRELSVRKETSHDKLMTQ